jgi:hypothetical protein
MTAKQLTDLARAAHVSGNTAGWLTYRAAYAGFREAGYTPLRACLWTVWDLYVL